MNQIKKSGGITTLLTASIAAALAPQVSMAASHSHASSAQSSLERRLQVMEQEMQALRAELDASRAKTEAETAEAKSEASRAAQQVQAQQAKVDQSTAELAKHEEKKDDLAFFRGGWAAMSHARTNELLVNNNLLSPSSFGDNKAGWYVGAGLDHRLSDDTFGISDDLALDVELMWEYKNYGSANNAFVSSQLGGIRSQAQVTMLSLNTSPKLKYTGIKDFRPWVIPFGLSMNVISPPSSGVTVLNPGLMLGTGLEYNIFKNLWVGADFRYTFTGGDVGYSVKTAGGKTILNSTDTDNYTAGAYVGIGF
ncbi:hypothetical protein [Methylococcus geothermalis]|uniref:Outer membrane protein beta-barrel domain-containing protein n=1 Tax=Methylococcus geothermalis TaxID=2681310 RepID=A0A858Q940_9GAMM|nr:hypothetical protein [Methylococcus geothermalis]QJD30350.1 hypothetical protein GNH96_10435 [Methylococcus geothermalis]